MAEEATVEHVGAGSADEVIVAFIAHQRIGAGATEQDVVVETARDLVDVIAAVDTIVAFAAGRSRRCRCRR